MRVRLQLSLFFLTIAALLVLPFATYAAPPSPFVGQWQAIDVDGSDIRLTIGGPPNGPFQITWTESYISFCDGEAGIVRGTGLLNEADANLLEADLHLECFTTGASLDLHPALRYHPATDTLSTRYENWTVVIWHRPGLLSLPTPLDLRVNYGHDWVESFYEAGHMAWITITESDGVTVKATAELVTEPKDFWEGETGFQTAPEDWDPAPPDIQPYDWVYGWVDNGANAQVQIGEINGMIDLEANSIEGTVTAPWFSDEVNVECHPWGAPEPQPEMKFDTVFPDGEDTYSCSWANEWDIQRGQDVGVGYSGPDGHWVANAFQIPNPEIRVWLGNQRVEGYRWPFGVDITLNIYDPPTGATYSDTRQAGGDPDWSFVQFLPSDFELSPGQEVTMTGGGITKTHTVLPVSITSVDLEMDVVAGTASSEGKITLCIYDGGCDPPAEVSADDSGYWQIDYGGQFDIRPGFGMDATEFDEDGDGTSFDYWVPNPRFTVFPEWEYVEGWEWLDGAMVTASVSGKPECTVEGLSGYPEWDPGTTFVSMNFPEGCDVVAGDVVTLTDAAATRTQAVQNLAVTGVDMTADTVEGTADPGAHVHVWPHEFGEYELQPTAGEDGSWLADFTSLGFDLQEGMCGRAEIRDEDGNSTAVDWCIPNPRFTVWPESDRMDGGEWPDGPVTVTVEGKPECSTEKISEGGYFNEPFPEGCDITVGDVVTFSDGVTTRSHTVRNLAVTAVDQAVDTVAGTADIGEGVSVGVYDVGGESELQLTVEDGTWLADFTLTGIDLVEGMCGYSRVDDEVGNVTQVDWCIPNPWFTAFPEQEVVEGWDWPLGTSVHLAINDPNTDPSPDYEQTEVVVLAPWESGGPWVWFDFAGAYNMKAGDVVTLTDGITERTHVVQNLSITAVDPEENTVTGTSDSGKNVTLWSWEAPPDKQMQVTADDLGNWAADFDDVDFDLLPGYHVRAEVWDEAGNDTAVDWSVPPPPSLLVQITEDWFEAQNFTPNAELTFWIYGAPGGAQVKTGTMQADDYGTVGIWVGDTVDLIPGNYLAVSDGSTTKELVLDDLTFDLLDLTDGHAEGTAPEPYGRPVWVGIGFEEDGWSMEVFTASDGSWVAGFGAPVPADYQWVAAQVFDEDGDASEVRPLQVANGQP